MSGLAHLDETGAARMVDVSGKADTPRLAIAKGSVFMSPETLTLIQQGGLKKGDVLAVARIAGIMAAKKTSDLIPLCHPLPLASVEVDLTCDPDASAIHITATCRLSGRTGVEMEALTAVAMAALTVYDMGKSIDRAMRISDIRLVEKSGGKSGHFKAE